MKGLVIRYYMNGYFLCDGKPPEGCENDGELYLGTTIRWFESIEDARAMRNLINNLYGYKDED